MEEVVEVVEVVEDAVETRSESHEQTISLRIVEIDTML